MKNFFLTGFPRSRTKWFAAYFSSLPGVYCHHEAMNGCHSREDFYQRMSALDCDYIGNSDSGLMYSGFQAEYMGCPTVIIERDIDDVYDSLRRMFGPKVVHEADHMQALQRQKAELDKLSGMRVPFEEIDSRLQEIHEHCVNVPFDEVNARRFINTNIQVDNLTVDMKSYRMWMGG